jgi:hypothetical protein
MRYARPSLRETSHVFKIKTERDVGQAQLELPGHGDPSSTPPCQHNLDRRADRSHHDQEMEG